ncbi:MAG: hypothetical protein SFV23_13675 [Planctomycetaceae bacterium]|nr:hypothetical protein [Planctomycetaceae bacterium]
MDDGPPASSDFATLLNRCKIIIADDNARNLLWGAAAGAQCAIRRPGRTTEFALGCLANPFSGRLFLVQGIRNTFRDSVEDRSKQQGMHDHAANDEHRRECEDGAKQDADSPELHNVGSECFL